MTEADLVRRAKRGERSAFAEIYRTHQPAIYRYIRYRVHDEQTAEDLTADVFVRMATGIKSFRYGGSPLLAWLYTIARNLVIDHHRRSKREASLPANNRWETDKEHVEQAVEQQLSHEKLATALQEITEDQRQVIWLKFIEGLSNPETAQILGKTVGAVKSLQHRALASLQRILQGI